MTYFQAPLLVEDALGLKFPMPSEYDFDLLEGIIKHRFQIGPGSKDVKMGNFEIFMARDSSETVTSTTRLIPGTAITMAVLVEVQLLTDGHCPMPRCRSDQSRPAPSGGRLW